MSTGNSIEIEFQRLNEKNEWSALFQKIRSETAKNGHTCTEALKTIHRSFNRYRDVNPYDHSRIVLTRGNTDYINANLVEVSKANRRYILTQGPLINTISHFWTMVWEQRSKVVVMLNKLIEKRAEKCFQYWPSKVGSEYKMNLTDVGLTLEYMEHQDHSYYHKRILKLTDVKTEESRDIVQFHYTTWPDFGVPCSPTALLEFLRDIRDAGGLEPETPAVIHCSAGIGRSGTFCLVDSCLVLIEKFGPNAVDVKEVLYEMRRYRMGLIQTAEQLRYCYQAIIEGIKRFNINNTTPVENHVAPEIIDNGEEDKVVSNDISESEDNATDSDDDGPPPLPPPRLDSLKKHNGTPLDRPLPNIPASVSMHEIIYDGDADEYIPSGPLPVVPGDAEEQSSEDELEPEELPSSNSTSEPLSNSDSLSASELRHRKRLEQKEKLESQVREMKRRQKANEHWTELKRSLYKPLLIAGTVILGGGLIAYLYFKN